MIEPQPAPVERQPVYVEIAGWPPGSRPPKDLVPVILPDGFKPPGWRSEPSPAPAPRQPRDAIEQEASADATRPSDGFTIDAEERGESAVTVLARIEWPTMQIPVPIHDPPEPVPEIVPGLSIPQGEGEPIGDDALPGAEAVDQMPTPAIQMGETIEVQGKLEVPDWTGPRFTGSVDVDWIPLGLRPVLKGRRLEFSVTVEADGATTVMIAGGNKGVPEEIIERFCRELEALAWFPATDGAGKTVRAEHELLLHLTFNPTAP